MQQGCRSAGIGCIECKQPVIDGILREQAPMRERAQVYLDDPMLVKSIIADGCEKAHDLARLDQYEVRPRATVTRTGQRLHAVHAGEVH